MSILKQLREAKGLYQKDIAAYLGIDRTTYVKYENGSSEPSMSTLASLADFFNVSLDDLFGRYYKQNKPTVQVDSELDELLKDPLNAKLWETLKKLSQEDKEMILGLLKLKLNQQD